MKAPFNAGTRASQSTTFTQRGWFCCMNTATPKHTNPIKPPQNPSAVEIKTSPMATLNFEGSPTPSADRVEKARIMPSTVPMMPTMGRSCGQAPTLASLVACEWLDMAREACGGVYGYVSDMSLSVHNLLKLDWVHAGDVHNSDRAEGLISCRGQMLQTDEFADPKFPV